MSDGKSRVRIIPATQKTNRFKDHEEGKKKRIAVYARVSTASEMQSNSYEIQVAHYTDYVNKNPDWELVQVYADEGITGTSTAKRTAFNQMIEDCENGLCDYIITKSISRFARNTLDCISRIRHLKSLNPPVGVFFEKEQLDTLDSRSELFLTILSSMAQEESRNVSENTKWGVQKRFQQGIVHFPTTYFLGYDKDKDGNIIIDEEQAVVVRRIFDDYLKGKGTPQIAKDLERDGIETARGNKHWTSNAVYDILRQEKYQGNTLTGKRVTVDYLTHKRVRNDNLETQYFVKNTNPPIIDSDTFERVQQEMKRRSMLRHDPERKYRQSYSNKSPFSNYLFCGKCGLPAHRRRLSTTVNKERTLFTAFHCRSSSGQREHEEYCGNQYVWEERMENSFIAILQDLKQNKAQVYEEVQEAIADVALSKDEQKRLDELNEQLGIVADRISELAGKSSGNQNSIYDATLRHLIYEQEILEQERDSYNESLQEKEYLESHLNRLYELLEEMKPEDPFDGDIFREVIDKGVIYPKRVVDFHFKCGIKRWVVVTKK
ncbi:recombinase family protein [Salisediminibacterium selenitireducens]|uniref:Resolvase domain protein n=1 Tax=Bacillus selenitireducens (strain ATCC 700615 / DSM 15326 / MLS10) TaxID=439292 RepID=D6XZG3_BACIE|nr:recombinase family protein [Salisediminibacterium selenitireducens]ADH98337.1 Resolvase domain protein [[Bacillus] selenitireducens MLS10]